MKTKPLSEKENHDSESKGAEVISLQRAKEIMKDEGIEYTDDELTEILHFISKVISITTSHYERVKRKQAKIISINTNTTHETKSVPLHPCEHRRAS